MADPTGYTHSYEFVGWQANNPSEPLPAQQVDDQFYGIETSLASVISAIMDVRRSDGALKDGIVTAASLDPGLLTGISEPTTWATATVYSEGDTVFNGAKFYVALTDHTSGIFSTDLAAGKWQQIADFTPTGVIDSINVVYDPTVSGLASINIQAAVDEIVADIPVQIADGLATLGGLASENLVTNSLIQDGAVSFSKMGAASVGTTNLVDASVTTAKLAAPVVSAMIPVGAVIEWTGPELPSLYLWARGSTVSRTTYAALLAATTVIVTATRSNTSTALTAVSKDVSGGTGGLGLVGKAIEGTGIPVGTTIIAATSTGITLSAPATTSGSGAQYTIFAHGNGDGVTTFGTIDKRGRVGVGRDNMGGASQNRLTGLSGGIDGDVLGGTGGLETHTLTTGQLASHSHGFANGSEMSTGSSAHGVPVTSTGPGHEETSTSTSTAGSGNPHNNVQPSVVVNFIIYAGV